VNDTLGSNEEGENNNKRNEKTTSIHRACTTLYRKYQPTKFSDIIGQEITVKILKKLLERSVGMIHHGILFSGIHGVGKTALARIFARAINCTSEDKPCGYCYNCKISENQCEDILEIDGATYTGIENIRKIIEDTQYMPFRLPFKVYYIDEVHMLSKSAFNSLLKVLEEPQEHVKFIFATTEKSRVPETIISRCLQLPLSRVSNVDIEEYLYKISKKEGVNIRKEVIKLMSESVDGSVRDALSLLERTILFDPEISLEDVQSQFKLVSSLNVMAIMDLILSGKPKEAIDIWQNMYNHGFDSKNMLFKMMELLSHIFLVKSQNMEPDENLAKIIKKYDISYHLLINFWEILIAQSEALFNGCDFVVETAIVMMTLIEDKTDVLREARKIFPSIKTI